MCKHDGRDSNPQPLVLETSALAIELPPCGDGGACDNMQVSFLEGRESNPQSREAANLRLAWTQTTAQPANPLTHIHTPVRPLLDHSSTFPPLLVVSGP